MVTLGLSVVLNPENVSKLRVVLLNRLRIWILLSGSFHINTSTYRVWFDKIEKVWQTLVLETGFYCGKNVGFVSGTDGHVLKMCSFLDALCVERFLYSWTGQSRHDEFLPSFLSCVEFQTTNRFFLFFIAYPNFLLLKTSLVSFIKIEL